MTFAQLVLKRRLIVRMEAPAPTAHWYLAAVMNLLNVSHHTMTLL